MIIASLFASVSTLFFDTKQEIKIDFLEDILFGTCGLLAAVIYINFSFKKFLLVLK